MSTIQRPPPDTSSGGYFGGEHPVRPGAQVAAEILIALGIFFLLANVFGLGGEAILLALGLAFLMARVTTGRYGFAVPAGLLLGLGAYVTLQQYGLLAGDDGGWALIFLGGGFLAAYVIGVRPGAVWPVIPAAILGGIGVVLLGAPLVAPLASYAWIASYWPLALIALGGWFLIRDRLDPETRLVGRVTLTLAILIYAVIAVSAVVAANTEPGRFAVWPATGYFPISAPTVQGSSISGTLGDGETLQIVNQTGGDVHVRPGTGSDVAARTTTAGPWFGPAPVAGFSSRPGVLVLSAATGWTGWGQPINLDVTVPANAPLEIQTSSGSVDVSGTSGALRVTAASGSIDVADVNGAVDARTASGSLHLSRIHGAVQATTASGSIQASGLDQVRSVTTASGSVNLDGAFAEDATISSVSGSLNVRFAPNSNTHIIVQTTSGSISANLPLAGAMHTSHSFDATLGAGASTTTIRTVSGSIALSGG
jgi:hypothetical protein